MAEQKTVPDPELDENGKPISDGGEDGKDDPSKKNESETEIEGEAEPEIPVRKSALQHIIARKNRQIERMRSKDSEENEEKEDDEDDGELLTPEARGTIQKEIARAVDPLIKSFASKADEDELASLLNSEPEAAQYEKRIRAYMKHPNYQGVPPSVIFHHLAFDAAADTGAQRKKIADLEAAQKRGGGRTTRPMAKNTGDVPSIDEQNEMTDAQFEELQARVRSGEFAKHDE